MPPPLKNIAAGRCVVPKCTSTKNNMQCHRFPINPEKSLAWKAAIKNPYIMHLDNITLHRSYFVCKLHFLPDDYVPQTRRPILKKAAIPTPLLPAMKDTSEGTSMEQENDNDENRDGEISATLAVTTTGVYNCFEPSTSLNSSERTVNSNVSSRKRKRSALLKLALQPTKLNPTARYLYKKVQLFRSAANVYRRRALSFKERLTAAIKYSKMHDISFLSSKLTIKR